jgi:hypothetical protein
MAVGESEKEERHVDQNSSRDQNNWREGEKSSGHLSFAQKYGLSTFSTIVSTKVR